MMEAVNESLLCQLYASELILGSAAYIIFQTDMWAWASRIVLLLWMALCVLFPFWPSILLFVFGLYGNHLLRKANCYKISENLVPITSLDIAITLQNPTVLFSLFGHFKKWMAPLVAGLFAMGAMLFFAVRQLLTIRSQAECLSFSIVLISFVMVFLYFKKRLFADVSEHFTDAYPFGKDARNHMGWTLGNWEFDSFSTLSIHLGMPAFILYTHIVAKEDIPAFFKKGTARSTPASDLVSAAERYIPSLPAQACDYQYPNIVVMQCESIFDPSHIFMLSNNYKSAIFTENAYTKCVCPLRVNVVGGGSWVSEFEFLSGLDSRLFGYLGYYTHVTLAPYIIGAFPTFLGKLGYATKAFYPATGKFYNAKNAYHKYGFNDFLDSRMLQLPDEWASSDLDIANAFVKKTHTFEEKPFFSYIVTNGAHGPYKPDNFLKPTQWSTSFLADCDPIINAQLNEYIRLLGQTEAAIQLILERLVQIEQSTGRPFVFLAYGDHQPQDFTETHPHGMRRIPAKKQTFVHMMSSVKQLEINFNNEIPLTLLSSILSASVVKQHKDLYALPNFHLYEKNGANFFLGLSLPGKWEEKNVSPNRLSIENVEAIAALESASIMKSVAYRSS